MRRRRQRRVRAHHLRQFSRRLRGRPRHRLRRGQAGPRLAPYAPIVFAASDEEAERAASWIAQGGKRDDGLERRQFAVEQADTFWLAEGYHQEYWQKWRPRYAALFSLVALQYADSKLDFLPPAADAACTILAVCIGLLFLGERVLDSETTKLGA